MLSLLPGGPATAHGYVQPHAGLSQAATANGNVSMVKVQGSSELQGDEAGGDPNSEEKAGFPKP